MSVYTFFNIHFMFVDTLFMYIVCYAKIHCVIRAELSSKPVVFLTG